MLKFYASHYQHPLSTKYINTAHQNNNITNPIFSASKHELKRVVSLFNYHFSWRQRSLPWSLSRHVSLLFFTDIEIRFSLRCCRISRKKPNGPLFFFFFFVPLGFHWAHIFEPYDPTRKPLEIKISPFSHLASGQFLHFLSNQTKVQNLISFCGDEFQDITSFKDI